MYLRRTQVGVGSIRYWLWQLMRCPLDQTDSERSLLFLRVRPALSQLQSVGQMSTLLPYECVQRWLPIPTPALFKI